MEGKLPNISGLAITTALKAFKYLVSKTDYDAKIADIESRYFTRFDRNKFRNEMIDNKIKEKQLVKIIDISGFIDNYDSDKIQQHQQQKQN